MEYAENGEIIEWSEYKNNYSLRDYSLKIWPSFKSFRKCPQLKEISSESSQNSKISLENKLRKQKRTTELKNTNSDESKP